MQHVAIEVVGHVGWLWLDRPEKKNALSEDMWADIPLAAEELAATPGVRAMVVAGRGNDFTVGIDLAMLTSLQTEGTSDAERRMRMYQRIKSLQHTMSVFAEVPVPVIAAVSGYCLGAGMDLITACDIRLSTTEAVFGVRETPMGLVADVGTLQRLPRIISPGHVAELAYTGADIDGSEAERIGLVNRAYPTGDQLMVGATALAERIGSNSPFVVKGVKAVLRAEEGMSTAAALDHVALWNTSFLQSNDLLEAMTAHAERRPPNFGGT